MSRGAQFYNCEDYLLAIEDLIATKGYARICELAETFRVQNASVSGMILRLAKKEWVVRRPYRAVTLTGQGRKIARRLRKRRDLLDRFFQRLGLKPSEAMRELHTLEHVLGFKAFRAIQNWLATDPNLSEPLAASHSISNNTRRLLTKTRFIKKDTKLCTKIS